MAAAGLELDQVDTVLTALALILSPAPGGAISRPLLRDADDEMVLEAAINGSANAIVTFEVGTFAQPAAAFGIEVLTPGAAWRRMTV